MHVCCVFGRDPRFDERCGKLDEQQFEKAYEFIADKRKKEIQTVKKSALNSQRERERGRRKTHGFSVPV